MKISQSLVRDISDPDVCGRYIHFKYVLGEKTDPTDAMFNGLYFEWHLLGTVRDGKEPKFEPLKAGGKPKDQQDLDVLIFKAKNLMQSMGINIASGEKQLRLETDVLEGHLDLVTNDFQNPERKAIYDVKWTATKYDDRWNGWGDAQHDPNVRLQSSHYTYLYNQVRGEYIPFYYFIFGKIGWVRVIKTELTKQGLDQHINTLEFATTKLSYMAENGFPASPEFNKCQSCPFFLKCDKRAILPTVETIIF